MDKPMRCQCGRTRTIVLDKHFRTALICPKCDEGSAGRADEAGGTGVDRTLKRDEIRLNRHRALARCLGMIFPENRFALFRIMLCAVVFGVETR